MKKIVFFALILATFIAIFCLSSSAADYGQQFLDPDYYEDDIAMVIGLYYDEDDTIFIPLMQIRVPDYSGGLFQCDVEVSNWDTDGWSQVVSFEFYQDSYVGELNKVLVDLSDLEFVGLDTYYIQSSYFDDPYFYIKEGSNTMELFASDTPYTSLSDTIIFFSLYCDEIYPEFSLPNPSTLEIPTYPARPIVPDPDPDIPLTPGAINNFLVNTLAAPIGIFTHIFESTGTTYAFVGCFMFFMFVKFVVNPVIGSGLGSDKVKQTKSDGSSDKVKRTKYKRTNTKGNSHG